MILKLIKKTRLAPEVALFRFVPSKKIAFKPGQWIMLYYKGQKRAYSISSSPAEKHIEFTIKINKNNESFSGKLDGLKIGAKLGAKGPFGMFLLKEKAKSIVFIAGGTGIAPFISMIRYAVEKNLGINMAVLFSCRTKKDILHYKELKKLDDAKKINLAVTLTDQPGKSWKGLTGKIDKKMIQTSAKKLDSPFFYICGPEEMTKSIADILLKMGVGSQKIVIERWGKAK